MKLIPALMALALIASAPAMAQDEGAMSVDLQTAISNALQHNKQLQASTIDKEIYYQKVREARSKGLPQVDAKFTANTYFNKSLDFGGMAMKMPNSLTFTATASWTFAMQQIASVKVAKIAQRLTDVTVDQTELDIKANVVDTYYAILVYERNLVILNDNLKDMQDIANHTARCYEVGTVEQTDVDQITINVTTLQNAILSLQRSLETTKKLLVLQMGIDRHIATVVSNFHYVAQPLSGAPYLGNYSISGGKHWCTLPYYEVNTVVLGHDLVERIDFLAYRSPYLGWFKTRDRHSQRRHCGMF